MPTIGLPPPPPPRVGDEVPQRFRVARATLLFDRFMTSFIKVGGVLVISAVAGICVFILWQIVPLFQHAKVKELKSIAIGVKDAVVLGVDEWSELPFAANAQGRLTFVDTVGDRPVHIIQPELAEPREISAVTYRQPAQELIVGTKDGRFAIVPINYSMETGPDGRNRVVANPKPGSFYQVAPEGAAIVQIAYGDSGEQKMAVVICDVNGEKHVHLATLRQKKSLLGRGKVEVGDRVDLTGKFAGTPLRLLVNSMADGVLIANENGEVFYFYVDGSEVSLRQMFKPFEGAGDNHVAAMSFILGDVSVVFTSRDGDNVVFSLYVPKGGEQRIWGQTKTFPKLASATEAFASSSRNKAFIVTHGRTASLRYSTTEDVRWEQTLAYQPVHAVISGKQDRIIFLDREGGLHLSSLRDPHPETSWRALFGKLWYEGASEPKYEWQSAGGTDDFEPKLSLIPLIVGTLKGTFYALLFALPVALLAALYTSVFLEPRYKRIVKPVMEIMASLPSVVLGFIAALWLAPLLETRVPSIIAMVIMVPSAAFLFGWLWSGLPYEKRRMIRYGYEFFVFVPAFLLVAWAGWQVGPFLERMLFTVTDPATGQRVADFRLWWPAVTGSDFQQRNSVVIGFIMGFAVIPIIFTITEDALSNVPPTLTSASMALGASRWQTAINVVLPTASAGIFSAIMIGLGRAIGETMIVVMATGNTPIMDLNIFSGMRTLSANIAVELPEAPHNGTLYRTLFLGAMLLFLMTFVVNTIAEVLRQRLREKYKTV
jgi:phosphate transport system permease protein